MTTEGAKKRSLQERLYEVMKEGGWRGIEELTKKCVEDGYRANKDSVREALGGMCKSPWNRSMWVRGVHGEEEYSLLTSGKNGVDL